MIISSELTGKTYETVDECLAAEDEFKRQEEEKERLAKARKEKIDEAYEEAIEACERYLDLVGIKYEPQEDGYKIKFYGDRADEIFSKLFDLMV